MQPLLPAPKYLLVTCLATQGTSRSLLSVLLLIMFLFLTPLYKEGNYKYLRLELLCRQLDINASRVNLRKVLLDMGYLFDVSCSPIWLLLNKYRKYSNHLQAFRLCLYESYHQLFCTRKISYRLQ